MIELTKTTIARTFPALNQFVDANNNDDLHDLRLARIGVHAQRFARSASAVGATMTIATRQLNAKGSRGPHGDLDSDRQTGTLVSDDDDNSAAVGAKRKRANGATHLATDDGDNSNDNRSHHGRNSRSSSRSMTRVSPSRVVRARGSSASVPSRSPSTESRAANAPFPSSSRRARANEQVVSVAHLQAQEREIALLKARMVSEERAKEKAAVSQTLRKGVRTAVSSVSSPPSSSKRSRARSMRPGSSMRRSPRSPAAADPRLAGVRKGVRKGVPIVDLDDGDGALVSNATIAPPRGFATTADAIQAAVLHSTAWRNVKLEVAPPNVLADAPHVAVPFALEFDAPLTSFSDVGEALAAKCAIVETFASAPPLSLTTGSSKEVARRAALEERVIALVDEAAPLIKAAHQRRAKTIILNARKQVRAYLVALPAHRERVEEIAGSFRPLQISRLEKVATRMILQNPRTTSEPIVYTVGRGESALSERDVVHDHAVALSAVAALSRSTTCMDTRGLVRVDDDPIIRFVPLFSDDMPTKLADAAARFDDDHFVGFGGGGGARGAVAAADDERKELLLRFVVAGVGGDAAAFALLRELGHFKQPLSDYVELAYRDARQSQQRKRLAALEQLVAEADAEATGSLYSPSVRCAVERLVERYNTRAAGALLRDRLARPPVHFDVLHLSEDGANDGLALRASARDSFDDMASRFANFFCRRCFAYNCASHGVNQPRPTTRIDPRYPVVKTAMKLERAADAVVVDNIVDHDSVDNVDRVDPTTTSSDGLREPEADDDVVESSTADADDDDDDSNAVRRSVRSRTAASTKASTILESQRTKEKRKTPTMRAHRGPLSDVSEFLGHDALYRSMTLVPRMQLLSATDACSPLCCKAVEVDATTVSATWSPAESLLLDKAAATLGATPCVVAALLRTKSCAAVAAALADRTRIGSSTMSSLLANAPQRDVARPVGARGNSAEHLRRTRLQRMKDRGANHEFVPCAHVGGAATCGSSDCSCMRRDHYCEKACACPADCANRFPGCKCAPGQCRSPACPCFFGARECDPDVCVSCGACELPVAIAAKATVKASKAVDPKAVMCGNVNLLRGAMRRIGVAASETHGWGAFALEPLAAGDFICEYTGELLSQDEAERRGNIYDKSTVSFLFDLNEDAVVDATRKGNKSKFANHTAAAPKCSARILRVNGEHRIGIFATAAIAAGEELFFDYGYSGVVPDWTRGEGAVTSATAVVTTTTTTTAPAGLLDSDANVTTTVVTAAAAVKLEGADADMDAGSSAATAAVVAETLQVENDSVDNGAIEVVVP